MTKVNLCLDLDTQAGRDAMRAYLASVERVGAQVPPPPPPLPREPLRDVFGPNPSPEPEPSPEPDPMPQPAPPPIDAVDAINWADLVARVIAGETLKEVASAAGVGLPALRMRVTRHRNPDMGRRPKAAAVEAPVSEAPVSEAIVPEAAPAEPGDAEQQPVSAPEPQAEPLGGGIDVQPEPAAAGAWSPREDLAIVRALSQGQNAYLVSSKLAGRRPADVVNRYRELVPLPGIAAQQDALRAAEARLRAAG